MQDKSLLANSDPEFTGLRPDTRASINATEAEFRAILDAFVAQLPPELYSYLQPSIPGFAARFVRGMLPLLCQIDALQGLVDILKLNDATIN